MQEANGWFEQAQLQDIQLPDKGWSFHHALQHAPPQAHKAAGV
jgi:hypothetical protein